MRRLILAALLLLLSFGAAAQDAWRPLGDANTWSTLRTDNLPTALEAIVPGLVYAKKVNCTPTVIGAGTCTVVPAVTGKSIVVWDAAVITLGGTAATCTSIELEDTAGTPKTVGSWTVAGELTQDVYEDLTIATATAANIGAALTSGLALVMTDTGSDCTGATSFDIMVRYTIG